MRRISSNIVVEPRKKLNYFIIIMKQKAKQTFPVVSILSKLIQRNTGIKKILVFFPVYFRISSKWC